MLGNAASRNNLIANLTAIPAVPVFIASHGSEIGIYSEIDLIALSIDNSNLFNNRNVYVYACYTANKLGGCRRMEIVFIGDIQEQFPLW
ncbi:MAG: hypothetical protein IPH46_07725 [Bacteroidetes bacterium]|nr:hypothetical protein [Bacteroidota bacterium]